MDKIICCQSHVRRYQAQSKYQKQKQYWKCNEKSVIKTQSIYRGLIERRKYQEKVNRFKQAIPTIVKVNIFYN
jgi:hypothetical protein